MASDQYPLGSARTVLTPPFSAAQAVEHYEIFRCGTRQLGRMDAVKLIDPTLADEKKTDETSQQDRRHRGERPGGLEA
ncbi:hypothetical protein [Bradyrhizobium sp. 26S5]|jgi:ferritin-like metal-binding protein YciE|uniref:hypothetical protein n=1 Tax=Bradyrhizobium sp. 26S5 TaxID=3139729 RepID=UPI0039C857D7